ncbi:hypothetical protein [Aeromicrobium sp.]|uniref:hypothetical protein n=1 Tax=Aeromicrobium sp. TaxID=1871063 RepID=UPI002FC98A58
MAISDIREQVTTVRKGPPCEVCGALSTLPEGEADALRALLADPTVRYSTLSEALLADEDTKLDINEYTLSRHARGKCAARERLR